MTDTKDGDKLKGQMLVAGHRDIGIFILCTSRKHGTRTFTLTKEAIDVYAKVADRLPDIVFSELSAILTLVSKQNDVREQINTPSKAKDAAMASAQTGRSVQAGAQPTNADFCFVSEFFEDDLGIGRSSTRTGVLTASLNKFFPDKTNSNSAVLIEGQLLGDFKDTLVD